LTHHSSEERSFTGFVGFELELHTVQELQRALHARAQKRCALVIIARHCSSLLLGERERTELRLRQ